MASVLVIHGIGQEMEGPNSLYARLFPALLDGVNRAGSEISPDEVCFASYGELFRPPGEFLAPAPYYDASSIESGYEEDLLMALWERAAAVDMSVVPPDEEVLSRASNVRRALAALSGSRFLSGVAERAFIGALKQVSAYFRDYGIRAAAQEKVALAMTDDTRLVIGHSLGSVVAYETLFTHPRPNVRALVTLGSPLGLRNLIFDRLRPAPVPAGESGQLKGVWPPVEMWGNVADDGDIVAVAEDLRPLFSEKIRQARVHNGLRAHDMVRYLEDAVTGQLITAGLDA
jgi:pimeloyl-ACP methyl ester carboxylesterase